MRTLAVKETDMHGEHFKHFGISLEHLPAWGYTGDCVPEVWEVDVVPDENQEGIGKDWDSCEYFGFAEFHNEGMEDSSLLYREGDFDANGNPIRFRLIQRNFKMYHIQFPYGYKAHEKVGKHYRLNIIPIKRVL